MRLLLDTNVLLFWLAGGGRLSPRQRKALATASAVRPVLLSAITLWEVATLYELGRIELDLPLREWLERAVAPPLVDLVPLTPAIAAEVAALPPTFHRDPADRIIVASARVHGATLVTSDQRIEESEIVPCIS